MENLNKDTEEEQVILVNSEDLEIGVKEKLEAHKLGLLHRAFSVFIFNKAGQILLQRRAVGKYHSEGLWTNTCCSHPRPAEKTEAAANRRLYEEMRLEATLTHLFQFTYKVNLDHDLIEHELDHVYFGLSDDMPVLNLEEADAYRYEFPESIFKEVQNHPERFSAWFKIIFKRVVDTVLAIS